MRTQAFLIDLVCAAVQRLAHLMHERPLAIEMRVLPSVESLTAVSTISAAACPAMAEHHKRGVYGRGNT
jgi:hypothetical protein